MSISGIIDYINIDAIKSYYEVQKASNSNQIEANSDTPISYAQNEIDDDINDTATISDQALKLYHAEQNAESTDTTSQNDSNSTPQISYGQSTIDSDQNSDQTSATPSTDSTNSTTNSSSDEQSSTNSVNKTNGDLTPEQQEEVRELKARDTEVRAHEAAHLAAAAGLSTSAPSYTYQAGPDGQKYAIGGEVSISFQQSNDPEENLRNAETMKAAALAPADPSSQDRAVAASADKMIQQAQEEIQEQKEQELQDKDNDNDNTQSTTPASGDTTTDQQSENQTISSDNTSSQTNSTPEFQKNDTGNLLVQ